MDKGIDVAVDTRLKRIFNERFRLKPEIWDEQVSSLNLLESKFGFTHSELLYLFFDIEKEFRIRIPEEEVAVGKFDCFNNIYKVINEQIVKSDKI